MGQLFSFSLPIVHSWPAAESSKLATTSKTSPSSNLCSERRGSNKRLAELDEIDAKFHPLCRHFGRFRTGRADDELSSADQDAIFAELECQTKRIVSLESELAMLRRQLRSLGDLFDDFLDAASTARKRSLRKEAELEQRLARLELERTALDDQIASKQPFAGDGERTLADDGRHSEGERTTDAPLQTTLQSIVADADDEFASFVADLPAPDESGQLTLNKFKYSCQFAQLLYTGGPCFNSVFCNMLSNYPATFIEELIEHALTTIRPGAMVSRIFIWLAADEPWPDMTTLFPNVERREIVEDRVRYEFDNIGQSCGQHKRPGFVLRIRAPSRAQLFHTMTNFSLSRL